MANDMEPEGGTEQSDAELLAVVATQSGAEKRAAQAAFYQRHVRYLFGVLHGQRDKLLKLAGLSAEDVVHDTFQRAFDRATTFKGDAGLEPERARRRTRAWLGRIAQHLIADAFRRFREVSASSYLDQLSAPAPEEPAPERPELAAMHSALGQLTEREQDILRVSALYFKAEGRDRLPNAVSAELSERWGISNDNLRAIRKRALDKLRRALGDGLRTQENGS